AGRKLPTLALAARLVSRAPDITRLLDKLEERGLIVRERPADNRRMVLIGLAAAGSELLVELDDRVRDCHFRQLGHLSEPQLRALIELLEQARRVHEEPGNHWMPPV
ncbi:MAG: MarR family transcriptional regulator, partial [Pirellulales bacterium]